MVRYSEKYSVKCHTIEYPLKFVKEESSRCIQCNEPNCVSGCPYGLNIPALLLFASSGDLEKSRSLLETPQLFDLSRSCLTERPCEKSCTLAKKGKPVSIQQIEMFLLRDYKKV